jgi:CrcB protein
MTEWLLVAVGAAVGAPLRYLADRFVQSRVKSLFPYGTLTVNVVASFVLGFLTGAVVPDAVLALVGTGFCGALSTYSTFSYETLRLFEGQASGIAVVNVVVSVVGGVAAVLLGLLAGSFV